jgi:hypothetical protein
MGDLLIGDLANRRFSSALRRVRFFMESSLFYGSKLIL